MKDHHMEGSSTVEALQSDKVYDYHALSPNRKTSRQFKKMKDGFAYLSGGRNQPAHKTVTWLNIKSVYGFTNRNDTHKNIFVHQPTIIQNNPEDHVERGWSRNSRVRRHGFVKIG